MKRCQKCNSLMPEDAMRCISCGLTSPLKQVLEPPSPVAAPVTRQASVKVGLKEILIAIVVVAVMLSLAWFKETGNAYAAMAFSGLTRMALVTGAFGAIFVLLRRRQETEEKGATSEPERMPKQIRYAIFAIYAGFLTDAVIDQSIGFAIMVFFNALLLFLIARRHNWARWTFVVLTGLVVVGTIPALIANFGSEPWIAIWSALEAMLLAAAVVLLLTRPAAQWCKKVHDRSEQDAASAG